tara:strand:+ start:45533 stop:45766 length:234 start_codon:yes stop_codon:yes gene_type:complete
MELGWVRRNAGTGADCSIHGAGSEVARVTGRRTQVSRNAEAFSDGESDRSLPQQARSQVERPSETSGRTARSEPPQR